MEEFIEKDSYSPFSDAHYAALARSAEAIAECQKSIPDTASHAITSAKYAKSMQYVVKMLSTVRTPIQICDHPLTTEQEK